MPLFFRRGRLPVNISISTSKRPLPTTIPLLELFRLSLSNSPSTSGKKQLPIMTQPPGTIPPRPDTLRAGQRIVGHSCPNRVQFDVSVYRQEIITPLNKTLFKRHPTEEQTGIFAFGEYLKFTGPYGMGLQSRLGVRANSNDIFRFRIYSHLGLCPYIIDIMPGRSATPKRTSDDPPLLPPWPGSWA